MNIGRALDSAVGGIIPVPAYSTTGPLKLILKPMRWNSAVSLEVRRKILLNYSHMNKEYVVRKDDAYRVAGTRVSLDSVVYEFLKGRSPESTVKSFPTLSLEQVYGAITYYLAHREEIDVYLREGEAKFEELRKRSRELNPELTRKLESAKRTLLRS